MSRMPREQLQQDRIDHLEARVAQLEAQIERFTVLQAAREHGHDALETLTDALGPSPDEKLLPGRT